VIRVLLAEDMRILRDTLAAVLGLEADIEVVAQVADGNAIVPAALARRPDVAVVDIDLPGADGLDAAARLREQAPDCRVLILTVLGQPGNLRRALAVGVAGFLPKETPAGELVAAVRRVAAGEKVIDPPMTADADLGATGSWRASPCAVITERACATASLAVTPAAATCARAEATSRGRARRAAAIIAATSASRWPTAACSDPAACSRSRATARSVAWPRACSTSPTICASRTIPKNTSASST
jgi:two-component system, NarL family, response regulator DesR